MYYKCTAEMHVRCSNSVLCHLCDGERLFKDPVAEKKAKLEAREQKKREQKTALLRTYQKEKKEGMGFEKRVAGTWNEVVGGESGLANKKQGSVSKPRIEVPEAKRQPNSGATWKAKGDIKLQHALMECKERGSTNSRGEKQITIPKEWLDKMVIEAYKEGRDYWYLPFGYKGSDDIYLVKPYNHEISMVVEMRQMRERLEVYEAKLREVGIDPDAIME